jgi:hypothetical protein
MDGELKGMEYKKGVKEKKETEQNEYL